MKLYFVVFAYGVVLSQQNRQSSGQVDWAGMVKQATEVAMPLLNQTAQMAMQIGASTAAAAGAAGAAGIATANTALQNQLLAAAAKASIDTSCLNPQIQDVDNKLQQAGIPKSKLPNTCIETVNNKGVFMSYLQKCLAVAVLDVTTQSSVCTACVKDHDVDKRCIVNINGTSLANGNPCVACEMKATSSPSTNDGSTNSLPVLYALLAFMLLSVYIF
jgi:hypothetical protein